ncbi:MAG: DUF523 and DUF1722 domain-containing protein [Victivallales bacterium]|nr:DUF523 and DUF1722 domain-containing protein [Victivallales bacterium]
MPESDKIKLGISSCLLGEAVRYDGQHKHDHYLTDVLGKYVDWLPVCPEVECGLPIPREAMHLTGNSASPHLVTVKTGRDLTEQMRNWCSRKISELEKLELCGFVFKSKSPSSGLYNVKIYNAKGVPQKNGTGMFARTFTEHFPLLPVEEEGRLHDAGLRSRFIDHVAVYSRWQAYLKSDGGIKGLQNFHARHKYMIMAHSPEILNVLGRLAAEAAAPELEAIRAKYLEMLTAALKKPVTVKKNTNVLQHIAGYFKADLEKFEKQELQQSIADYHQELFPLLASLVMLRHYARKYDKDYLLEQYYLSPGPMEMYLKYHV